MWYKIDNQTIKITILAKPHAKKTALIKIDERGMHIALHAKPHQGEANKTLINYLAKLFHVPKSKIVLNKGESGRQKQVILPLTDEVYNLVNTPDQLL